MREATRRRKGRTSGCQARKEVHRGGLEGRRREALHAAGSDHLAKETSFAKFDETVEVHLRTGLDPRHADQQIRGSSLLPHGLGKTVQRAGLRPGRGRAAGGRGGRRRGRRRRADQAGRGRLHGLRRRARAARHDGQGRPPGSRARSPGSDAEPALGHRRRRRGHGARRARRDARAASSSASTAPAIVHCPIGKVSFDEQALEENMATLVSEIVKAKPSGQKGEYIKSITLTTTMGPGFTSTRPRRYRCARDSRRRQSRRLARAGPHRLRDMLPECSSVSSSAPPRTASGSHMP